MSFLCGPIFVALITFSAASQAENTSGHTSIGKCETAVLGALAKVNPKKDLFKQFEDIVSSAGSAVSEWMDNLLQKAQDMQKKTEPAATAAEPTSAITPEQLASAEWREKTQLRIGIAGHYPTYIEQAMQSAKSEQAANNRDQKPEDKYFEGLLALAEGFKGAQSSRIYTQLREYLSNSKAFDEDHQKQIRALILSLFRVGQDSEARQLFQEYFAKLKERGAQDEKLAEFLNELLPLKQTDIIRQLYEILNAQVTSRELHIRRIWKSEYSGDELTAQGKAALDKFVDSTPLAELTAERVFAFVKELEKKGQIKKDSWKTRDPRYSGESRYIEDIIKYMAPAAPKLSQAAARLKDLDVDLANSYLALAKRILEISGRLAERDKTVTYMQWAHGRDSIPGLRPGMSVREVEAVLKAAGAKFSGSTTESMLKSQETVISLQLKDPHFFAIGLQALYKMDASLEKAKLFAKATESFPKDFPKALIPEFLSRWKSALNEVYPDLLAMRFVEEDYYGMSRDYNDQMAQGKTLPGKIQDSHFYQAQQLAMALFLLEKDDAQLKQMGMAILKGIPSKGPKLFNVYNFVSRMNYVFMDPMGYSVSSAKTFDFTDFKFHALLEAATASEKDKKALVLEAFQMRSQVKVKYMGWEPTDFDLKFHHQIALFDLLLEIGEVEKAESMVPQFYQWLKEAGGSEIYDFWKQHFDTAIRAKLAIRKPEAEGKKIVDEITSAFKSEVDNHRQRFDERSMIMTALELSKAPHLREASRLAFEYSITKLALLRGDERRNLTASTYFKKALFEAQLPGEMKDELFAKLIEAMVPDQADGDEDDLLSDAVAFASLLYDIAKGGDFPKTELKGLKILEKLAQKIHFDPNDFMVAYAKNELLLQTFKFLTAKYPEIADPANAATLQAVVTTPASKVGLARLMGQENAPQPENSLDLDFIRAGGIDLPKTYQLAQDALNQALKGNQSATLDSILEVYKELLHQEIQKLILSRSRYKTITIEEILGLTAFRHLMPLVQERVSLANGKLMEGDRKILKVLLESGVASENDAKAEYFKSMLKDTSSNLDFRKLVFENFVKIEDAGKFAGSYYEQEVTSQSIQDQVWFFKMLAEILEAFPEMPRDEMMPFLLTGDHQEVEALMARIKLNLDRKVLFSDSDGEGLSRFHLKSNADYFVLRDAAVRNGNFWQPDLLNEGDIIGVYFSRFAHFITIEQFAMAIEAIYFDQAYTLGFFSDHKHNYSVDNIQNQIRKFFPQFVFSADERASIEDVFLAYKKSDNLPEEALRLPRDRGFLDVVALTRAVRRLSSLTKNQTIQLQRYLSFRENKDIGGYFANVFGNFDLYQNHLPQLRQVLDKILEKHRYWRERDNVSKLRAPEWFKKLPLFVRTIMTRLFAMHPYGERDAIIKEIEGKNLTSEQGVRRFFELTNMDKLGQFLSTRRDLIPESYRLELAKLQEDRASASSIDEVRETIETELKAPLDRLFRSFNPKPIKAGTIGEVYEAETFDGRKVAVKVITPSKRKAVHEMLERLDRICEDMDRMRNQVPGAFDPLAFCSEFRTSMFEELSFVKELENGERMRPKLPEGITIPQYIKELSNHSVLTQVWAQGVHVKQVQSKTAANKTIQLLSDMLIYQLTEDEDGEFHDDIHPGNLRVDPRTGHVELLDFGRVARITPLERGHLVPFIVAVRMRNAKEVATHMIAVSPHASEFNLDNLTAGLSRVLAEPGLSSYDMIDKVFAECQQHGLFVSGGYLKVMKAIMSFEETAKILDKDFDFESYLTKTLAKKLMTKAFGIFTPGRKKK